MHEMISSSMVKNFVQFSNDKNYEFAKIGIKIIRIFVVSVGTGLTGCPRPYPFVLTP